MAQATPEVTWAQRSSNTDASRNYLFVYLNTPDVEKSSAKLNITPSTVSFNGLSHKGVTYVVSLDLYDEIDPENSRVNHTGRGVEMVLRKKELKQEYWPRLLKTDKKVHFLKTDFDKWVDEDEQDETGEDDYANNFGGLGDEGGLGNIDFSKLGALNGGADAGAEDQTGGDEEEEEEEEGEENMPELEEAKQPETKS